MDNFNKTELLFLTLGISTLLFIVISSIRKEYKIRKQAKQPGYFLCKSDLYKDSVIHIDEIAEYYVRCHSSEKPREILKWDGMSFVNADKEVFDLILELSDDRIESLRKLSQINPSKLL